MRIPKKPRSKKALRKRRKGNESELKDGLKKYCTQIDSGNIFSDKEQHKLLLYVRWPLFGLIYDHLNLSKKWKLKEFFLELPDIHSVERRALIPEEVIINGYIIWWAEGKDAQRDWVPSDRIEIRTKRGGRYMKEPFRAKIFPHWNIKRRPHYIIEFGLGSTYQIFRNFR